MRKIILVCLMFLPAMNLWAGEAPVVLIHGAHFDGESWDGVKQALEKEGRKVLAPTLPGRPVFAPTDLMAMTRFVCDQVEVPSVLVGHSMGGMIITQMTETCPEKVKQLIYVTAILPLPGQTLFEQFSKEDETVYQQAIAFGEDRTIPRDHVTFMKVFEPRADKAAAAKAKIYPESTAMGDDPVSYSREVFAKIPQAYIFATKDVIVTPASQKKFSKRMTNGKTYEIRSGHLPMLRKPDALAALLTKIINGNEGSEAQ